MFRCERGIALGCGASCRGRRDKKGRAGEVGSEDVACIVAAELIGINIAEYIDGKKALFNFFYYDTRKQGILEHLGVSMGDAIGGLIAGCMTEMLG
jgi:alpha-ribazole phosphatase CobZ